MDRAVGLLLPAERVNVPVEEIVAAPLDAGASEMVIPDAVTSALDVKVTAKVSPFDVWFPSKLYTIIQFSAKPAVTVSVIPVKTSE